MAVRWMMALVDPPSASSTRSAFSTERGVMTWLGRIGAWISRTAAAPLAQQQIAAFREIVFAIDVEMANLPPMR